MRFNELKHGNTVYMLKKSQMTVQNGTVQTVSFPHVGMTGNVNNMVVDVTIESNGKVATYTIPETLSVTYTGDLVLATEQQSLSAEVQRMKAEAGKVLASVEHHKTVIERADELLAELNPAIKERQETEKRFSNIENSVNGLKGMMQTLLDKLS